MIHIQFASKWQINNLGISLVPYKKIYKIGHIGHIQVLEHFAMKHYTEKMNQIIIEIINSCDACLKTKQGPSYGTM